MSRKMLVALLATLAALAGAPAIALSEGGAKNVVLVFNEADGSQRSRAGIGVAMAASPSVESENLAFAKSHCTGCRTVAAAMQAVLITRDANVITPRNAAVAINEECTACETFAAAYQYVISTPGPVYLGGEAEQEIRDVRAAAADLVASDLPFPELEAQLDALYEQFKAIVDRGLQQAGHGFEARSQRHVQRGG